MRKMWIFGIGCLFGAAIMSAIADMSIRQIKSEHEDALKCARHQKTLVKDMSGQRLCF